MVLSFLKKYCSARHTRNGSTTLAPHTKKKSDGGDIGGGGGGWTLDDDAKKDLQAKGSKLISTYTKSGNKANALYGPERVLSTRHPDPIVYAITFHEVADKVHPFVGLSPPNKFASGWGIKGLLFGGPGNLSDGSSLVKSGYHDEPFKAGDCVRIFAKIEGGTLSVYFKVNNKPLGKAYSIDIRSDEELAFNPVVSLTGSQNGRTELSIETEDLGEEQFQLGSGGYAGPQGFDGQFRCIGSDVGVEGSTVPATFHVKKNGTTTLDMGAHVGNSLNATYDIKRFNPDGDDGGSAEVELRGAVASSKMMPAAPVFEVEQRVGKILNSLEIVSVGRPRALVLKHGCGDAPSPLTLEAFTRPEDPAGRDAIRWLN